MAACVCFCGRELDPFLPEGVIRRDGVAGGKDWPLCAMSPSAARHLARQSLRCGTLLVQEDDYRPAWKARQVVSYGLSSRSSLTLSSMGERDMLCVQRTLTDLLGRSVECQELPLPAAWCVFSPAERLLLAGVWLLYNGAIPISQI